MKRLFLLLLILTTIGCVAKEPALRAIDHLEAGTAAREKDLERLITVLIKTIVLARHDSVAAERDRLIATAELDVYRRTDMRIAQVIKETRAELNGLFGPSA